MLQINKNFKPLNKSRVTLVALLFFGLAIFIFDCECEVETAVPLSSDSITTTNTRVISSNNYEAFFHDTNDFSNYHIFTNLLHYEVYELEKSHYTLIEEGGETISNFQRFTTTTNYSTNILMTNTTFPDSFISNQTFQTTNNDFIVTNYGYAYELINDDNAVGYSNYFQGTNVRTNRISTFPLAPSNLKPEGMTSYNNKFYIVDNGDVHRVYIYNNSGTYETNFTLNTNHTVPTGITAYNDEFYVTDFNQKKVYIYNNTGIYQRNSNLNNNNSSARGIITYNDNFYIISAFGGGKIYLYDNAVMYQNNFTLNSGNRSPQAIVAYNNNFYVINKASSEIYIYNISGIEYQGKFNLHIDNREPGGIELYNSKFYVTDKDGANSKMYIYPID